MRQENDGMLLVRADLCERLERLQRSADRLTVRDLVKQIAAIRIQASAYGLSPLASLALAFERAIQAEPRFCPAALYFDRLRDAIGCERVDDEAADILLASISVRLGA